MSNVVGLHSALTGPAARLGPRIASDPVANANGLGDSRQRVDLAARSPNLSLVGLVGTGIDAREIGRLRAAFLDRRVRTTQAQAGWDGARAQSLARAEAILGEPEHGPAGELGGIWDAFENLALDPSNAASRQEVLAMLGSFAARARALAAGWDGLARDTNGRIERQVAEANDLLDRVVEINRTPPVAAGRGHLPKDLLDEWGPVLDRLSETLGVVISHEVDGRVTVGLDGETLVGPGIERRLSPDGSTLRVVDPTAPEGPGEVVVPSGEVGGLTWFVTEDLPRRMEALDEFVRLFASTLNEQHAEGVDAGGKPGGVLFAFEGSPGAATVWLGSEVATGSGKLAAGYSCSPLDGRNAQQLAAFRRKAVNGSLLDARLVELVVGLGAEVATARRAARRQGVLTVAAENARAGAYGASLDEEVAALVPFQRLLEATSRVMTAVDEALDTLVNGSGIVGR